MKHDKAIELAEALESGKYQQGKGVLKCPYEEKFCCLGVASELIDDLDANGRNCEQNPSFLSQKAMEYYGFQTSQGIFEGEPEGVTEHGVKIYSLTGMNDTGRTFKEIAAFIRERWEDL